jgi:flagellar protein FliO/FliZ
MDTVDLPRFLLAFIFVIGLIGLCAVLLKRYGGKTLIKNKEGSRLDVVEVRYIDSRRKLALVRRDNVEHLLLLADGKETLIESGIKKDA